MPDVHGLIEKAHYRTDLNSGVLAWISYFRIVLSIIVPETMVDTYPGQTSPALLCESNTIFSFGEIRHQRDAH